MCALCEQFVAAGGQIVIYPEGFSGRRIEAFRERARRKAIAGWLARFGSYGIPGEALPHVLALHLPIPAARVALVWDAARDEPRRLPAIAERTRLNRQSCVRTAAVLVGAERMAVERGQRGAWYLALGEIAPHWRDFLKTRLARAA